MSQQTPASSGANGQSTVHDIFALSDEQILEIDPQPQDVEGSVDTRPAPSASASADSSAVGARLASPAANGVDTQTGGASPSPTNAPAPAPQEPPAWLAAQMKDTWNGADARALWDRVQSSENEAAAYREVFAKPEDARALKTLYPGGVAQAQAAAERARLLDEIDRAYFAAQAGTPEQARASRAQLAAMMLREDPAAFREMVHEGLRALEAAGAPAHTRSIADALAPTVGARLASPVANGADTPTGGASPSPTRAAAQHAAPQLGNASANAAQLAAYSAFERAANAELEKTVGGAIDHALHQALPNIADSSSNVGARFSASPGEGTQETAPLQARLSRAIREDVERALQGDRQLGEQVAQILSSRRLDDATRAQVVRLINERALQLVPAAAKRALNEWTQTTLATHRSRTTRSDAATSRREVVTAAAPRNLRSQMPAEAARSSQSNAAPAPARSRINYGKLSDEQILDL